MEAALSAQLSKASRFVALKVSDLRSLEGIEAYPQIEDLSFYGGATPPLEPLAGLPALRTLSLGSGPCPDLRPLAGLPLASLNLSSCTRADTVGLQSLPALRALTLPESTRDLSFLNHLHLDALTLGAHYAGLATVKAGIQELRIQSTRVVDLGPISHLHTLRQLKLGARRCGVSDLRPLAGLQALERLSVDTAAVSDLSPLAGLSALKTLSLGSNKRLADLSPLAGLSALESLDLNLTAVADLSPLAGLQALEVLMLRGTRVESIQALLGLTRLRVLYLERSRLRSIAGISRCAGLELLWFWGTRVRDLTPLEGLNQLQNLNIADLGEVTGAEVTGRLPALKYLDVINTTFDPQILRGKVMEDVRGCPYPPPGELRLEGPESPTAQLGPGKVLDGRFLACTLPSQVKDLALSADGSRLAIALREGLRVYTTVDGAQLLELPAPPRQVLTGVAYGSDGALYLATQHDVSSHDLRVWRKRDESPLEPFAELRMAHAPRLLATRQGLLIAAGAGVRVWRVSDGHIVLDLPPAPSATGATVVAYAEATCTLFVHGTVEGKVIALNAEGVETGRWDAVHGRGEILTVTDDGRYFTSMGFNCYGAVLVDTRSGERLYTDLLRADGHGGAAVLSRDGSLVVDCHYTVRGLRLPPRPEVQEAWSVPARGITPNNACVSGDDRILAFSTFNYRLGDFRVFWGLLVNTNEERVGGLAGSTLGGVP